MDLLERYLTAVQQELPPEKQQDVSRELRANILDQLDGLREASPEQSEQKLLHDVLLELGSPRQMAQRFHPPQPLIQAEHMPIYRYTTFIVLGVLFVIGVIHSSLHWLGSEHMGLLLFLKHLAGGFIRDACFAFTMITLAFILMGRNQTTEQAPSRAWNPSQLPAMTHGWQRIDLSTVFHDLATYVFLLILIWYPVWAEVQTSIELTSSSRTLLMVFSPLLLGGIAHSLWQLQQRYWSMGMLKSNLVLNGLMLCAILILALSGPLLTGVPEPLAWMDARQLERSITISLLIIALFPAWELLRDGRRLRKR